MRLSFTFCCLCYHNNNIFVSPLLITIFLFGVLAWSLEKKKSITHPKKNSSMYHFCALIFCTFCHIDAPCDISLPVVVSLVYQNMNKTWRKKIPIYPSRKKCLWYMYYCFCALVWTIIFNTLWVILFLVCYHNNIRLFLCLCILCHLFFLWSYLETNYCYILSA